jgi:hypothetical protein
MYSDPYKNDLELGAGLVLRFVEIPLPDEYHRVQKIFRRPGTCGRFKDLLESKRLLASWCDFEGQLDGKAIRQ